MKKYGKHMVVNCQPGTAESQLEPYNCDGQDQKAEALKSQKLTIPTRMVSCLLRLLRSSSVLRCVAKRTVHQTQIQHQILTDCGGTLWVTDVRLRGIHPVTVQLCYSVIALPSSALRYGCVPVSLNCFS